MGAFKIITYSLKGNLDNSDKYYNVIKKAKDEFYESVFNLTEDIIKEYMTYLKDEKIEKVRSQEEYFIEFIMINIFLKDYNDNAQAFNVILFPAFRVLFALRKKEKYKNKVDKIRGLINYNLLLKKKCNKPYNLKKLIIWLKACGDFEEEVVRIQPWYDFFCKNKNYFKKFIDAGSICIEQLQHIGEKYLSDYTENIINYLNSYKAQHNNKEDIIYCGKSILQYYYNMICSEIMNDVYHKRFLFQKSKMIFAPACMRQNKKKCMSIKSRYGYKCIKCSKVCSIRSLTEMGEQYGFEVYTIPHESDLSKLYNTKNSHIGIIGIACVLNLMSGGYKALRLGFTPQCLILDSCGCTHWHEKSCMTYINKNRLENILKN